MQSLRSTILSYARIRVSTSRQLFPRDENIVHRLLNMQLQACSLSSDTTTKGQILDRVIALVKKSYKIDATKVTETADFQKDLSLDSLDRVELIMAFEEEFSIEIPDEEADKLKCCADVANYIMLSESGPKSADTS
ncbi:OLC1v1021109C1 [Oldenlandia corymbosa var. corymbosa]|uniref:Acyl carrier protein n=1 Tax=Oldenlandia corymbosa var. corymbosa TaxID=529605 RepID=A0AAV1BX47_OLDCO|nr:OLC1v1021109C1 [Oldenlandia corymbosa var. corymbosa]